MTETTPLLCGSNQTDIQATPDTALAILYARESDIYGDRKERKQREAGTTIETSPQQQIVEEKHFAKAIGATVLDEDIHIERFTGVDSIYDRPEIKSIRDKIRSGKYRYFICYDTDRLARDPIHTGLIMQECMKHKCELKFVKTPVENSDMGMVLLFVRGLGDKMEAAKLKDRARRGRESIIAAGRIPTNGKPLYGYTFDTARHVRIIHKEEATVVKFIFKSAVEGWSMTRIVRELNSKGVPSPAAGSGRVFRDESRGEPIWHSSQVGRILHEDQYTGLTIVDRHRMTEKRRANGKYEAEMKPRQEWRRIDNIVGVEVTPAIIDKEIFNAAQAGLQQRGKNSGECHLRNIKREFLLRGFIFCSKCGCKMYPNMEAYGKAAWGNARPRQRVYRCSVKRTKGAPVNCAGGRVLADGIESMVWKRVVEFYRNPITVEREVRRIIESIPTDTLKDDLAEMRVNTSKKEKLYTKLYDKMTAALADDDDIMAERLEADCKRLAEDIKALRGSVAQITSKLAAAERAAEIAKKFADYCRKVDGQLLRDDLPFERKVQMLKGIRVSTFAHAERANFLRTNLGALLELADINAACELAQTACSSARSCCSN